MFSSPDEFVHYVADTLKEERNIDQHWKHQHFFCPFCSLNFTVYAKVEEMQEDSAYFWLKSNLTDKVNF